MVPSFSTEVAAGSTTSTYYGNEVATINISDIDPPYTVDLWLRRNGYGCWAYNADFSLQQPPVKMDVTKDSAKTFVDVAGNELQAGLATFDGESDLEMTLAMMTPSNQTVLKNAIDGIITGMHTCIECGIREGTDELISSRARPGASKVIVLLTDGQANEGDSIQGAVYARDHDVTVHTIGFGSDVDEVELTNIALLTRGEYYYAPNAETLMEIFRNIGK